MAPFGSSCHFSLQSQSVITWRHHSASSTCTSQFLCPLSTVCPPPALVLVAGEHLWNLQSLWEASVNHNPCPRPSHTGRLILHCQDIFRAPDICAPPTCHVPLVKQLSHEYMVPGKDSFCSWMREPGRYYNCSEDTRFKVRGVHEQGHCDKVAKLEVRPVTRARRS